MMGTKIRSFSPLPDDLSLEDLVPEGSFYRRLQATLDLPNHNTKHSQKSNRCPALNQSAGPSPPRES